MNNDWENSWKAKKITKEIIDSLDIPFSTKTILIDEMFRTEDCCWQLCNLIEACELHIGRFFACELFHYFVKNGTIELKYF